MIEKNITENKTLTLATANTICLDDIKINVNIPGLTEADLIAQQNIEDSIMTETITNYTNNRINVYRARALRNQSNLISIDLPEVTIMEVPNAFHGCTSLTSVNLPKITNIPDGSFAGCSKLTTITLPSVTSISAQAFELSENFTTLILPGKHVCTLEHVNAFESTPISDLNGVIYVHEDLVNDYQKATNWIKYKSIIQAIPKDLEV